MSLWLLILYGLAAFLALRTLAALMTQHRQRFRQQLLREQEEEHRRARAAAKKDAQPPDKTSPEAAA